MIKNSDDMELLSKRLRLLPVRPQDDDFLFALLRHEKVKKYVCDDRDVEREFIGEIINKSAVLFKQKRIGLWLITDRVQNHTIGFCGFLESEVLEVIYAIHPDFQNNGFAIESTLKVIEHFRQLEPGEEIYARIDLPNIESHFVAKRIGMKEIGVEKNFSTGGDMKVYKLKTNP